jgi:hypothetical protein
MHVIGLGQRKGGHRHKIPGSSRTHLLSQIIGAIDFDKNRIPLLFFEMQINLVPVPIIDNVNKLAYRS